MKNLFCAFIIFASPAFVFAAEPESAHQFDGSVNAGMTFSSGNNDSEDINFGFNLNHNYHKLENRLVFSAVNSEQDNERNAERYYIDGQSRYNYTDKNYVYGQITFDKDIFSGYEYRVSEVLGFGRRIHNSDKLSIDAELGLGLRQSEEDNGNQENELIGKARVLWDWQVNEWLSYDQDLAATIGSENTVIRSISALKSKVSESLKLKLGLDITHTTDVPVGIKKTDRILTIGLLYDF